MFKYIAILLLVFSGSTFASSGDDKIELVCDRRVFYYEADVLELVVEGSVVVVNFE